jgi:hypothetical protein
MRNAPAPVRIQPASTRRQGVGVRAVFDHAGCGVRDRRPSSEVKRAATWSPSDRRTRSRRPALPASPCRVGRTADLMVAVENDGKVTGRRLFDGSPSTACVDGGRRGKGRRPRWVSSPAPPSWDACRGGEGGTNVEASPSVIQGAPKVPFLAPQRLAPLNSPGERRGVQPVIPVSGREHRFPDPR